MQYVSLIVGQHFRPPAKQVLAHVPALVELQLVLEDDNPYDPNAIKVMLDPQTAIPESQFSSLDQALVEVGMTLEQLMSGGPIHIGYIPASGGKPLLKAQQTEPTLFGNLEVRHLITTSEKTVTARLFFAVDGSPRIRLEA